MNGHTLVRAPTMPRDGDRALHITAGRFVFAARPAGCLGAARAIGICT